MRKSTFLLSAGGGGLLSFFAVAKYIKSNLILKPDMETPEELNRRILLMQTYFRLLAPFLQTVREDIGKKDLRKVKKELFLRIDETMRDEKALAPWDRKPVQFEPQDKELLWRFFIANAFSGEHAKKTRMWGKA